MFRRLIVATAILFSSSVASAQVQLEQKFHSGEKYETSLNAKITQKLTIGEADIDAVFEEHALLESRVGQRAGDGRLPIVERYTAWQAELVAADQQARFDLANPEIRASSNIDHFLDPQRVLAKSPRTVVLDGNARVVALEGYDALGEGLSDLSKQQNATRLSSPYYRAVIAAELAQVPTGELREQDTWERTTEYSFYGNQSLELTRRYKYLGIVEQNGRKLDRIELQTSKATYRLGEGGEIPITASKSDLTIASSTGELLFDRERGRIVSCKEKTRIQGDITLLIGDQQNEVPSKIDLTIETDSTLLP